MMKRKKMEAELPHSSSSERWLLTYSDMITLLLALFIILYSMSSIDAKKFAQIGESLSNALHTNQSVKSEGGTGGGGGSGSGGSGTGAGLGAGTGMATGVPLDALDEVYDILQSYVDKNHLENQIALVNTDYYVQIHLKDALMFVPDSARMLDTSAPVMQEIEKAIAQVYERVDHITISGHTADVGPHTLAGDKVSWRLSTERAVTVLTSLIGYGLPQNKLSIEGYAHFSPAASNTSEAGRAKNRRVEITVYKYPAQYSSPDDKK